MSVSNASFLSVKKALLGSKSLYLTGHINPDGDSVGAVLALAMGVAALGAAPVVFLDMMTDRYGFLSGQEYIYRGDPGELAPGAFAALDCASKARLPGSVRALFGACSPTVVIDHHVSNPGFGDINIIEPDMSSASEIIYDMLKEFGVIDAKIAEALLCGIIFDTGGLRHGRTTPATLRKVAELIELGADLSDVYTKTMLIRSEGEARILSKALENMTIEGNGVAHTMLSAAEMDAAGANYADLDGISEYLLTISGVKVSFVLSERPNATYKVSLRSKTIDVNEVAGVFGGGGHMLASGAAIPGSFEKTRAALLENINAALKAEGFEG